MSLQVGIIGGGGITDAHLMGYSRISELERTVVADPDETALAARKRKFPHIETTGNYRDILSDPRIPLVDVCLPHHLHHALAMEALSAGKDVFCEKPIATTLQDAREMVETADRAGRKLYVSLNQMFTPAHRKAKEMIEAGKLGRLLMGVWKMIGNELERMGIEDHWKGDVRKAGGGALIDTGMHAAYVMLDLFGPAENVSAFARRLVVPHANKGDDNSVAVIEFKSGAVATYAQSYTVRSEQWNERKYVYGTEGSLHIDDTSPKAPLTYHSPENPEGRVIAVEEMDPLFAGTVAESVVHHMSCYLNDRPTLYSTQLAVDALQLILALYCSSETGRAVLVADIK